MRQSQPVPRRAERRGRKKLVSVLRYALTLGRSERQIIEVCKKRGQPLPDSFRDAPELYLGLAEYYTAFWRLHTDRPIGMVCGQIPWSSIVKYAELNDMDYDELERFELLIRAMDDAWLEHANKPKDK